MINPQAQKLENDSIIPNKGKTKIETRFGVLEVDYKKAIYFPKGIYGFPENLHFALLNFPNPELDSYKILQCLNDFSVSFPVVAKGYNNEFIHEKDMSECANSVEVKHEDMALLFIATSEKETNGKYKVAINAKAPIVVDVKLQMAIQYIFTNNKYSTKHYI
jgi:flagellar assembly factor FliW